MKRAALIAVALTSSQAATRNEDQLTGLRGIRWGMSVSDAIALFGRSVLVQHTKTSISGC